MENLVFDPGAPGHTEAMVGDYRAALEAYDRAKAVPAGRPNRAALPFEGEQHGRDSQEVLAYDGPRTKVTVQVRTEGTWRLSFERPGRRDGTDWIHGLGDGMKELNVPGSGWLVIQVPDGGAWFLQLPS